MKGIITTSEIKAEQKPVDPKVLKEIKDLNPAFIQALASKRYQTGKDSKYGRGGVKTS